MLLMLLSGHRVAVRGFSSCLPLRRVATVIGAANKQLKKPTTQLKQQQQQQQQSSSIMTEATNGVSTMKIEKMTEDQRYLFDLNGYIIVRNVLTPEEIKAANQAIDNHAHEFVERKDDELRNAKIDSKMRGLGPGRKDLGRVLEWGPESRVFQSILAHPKLVGCFHDLLGQGYRMDHLPFVIAQDYGGEGFSLHGGTIDCSSGEYNPELAYTCMHDTIRCSLLGVNVMLTDHNAGNLTFSTLMMFIVRGAFGKFYY